MTQPAPDEKQDNPEVLRRRVEELEQQVRALERQLQERSPLETEPPSRFNWLMVKQIAAPALLTLLTLTLAGVMPGLVVRHRWLDPLIADKDSLVFLQPWMDPAWKKTIHSRLAKGKQGCSIRAENGDERFVLWYDREIPYPCSSRPD